MYAYLEILAGLIRYGPRAHEFPDPYVGTITFSASKQVAELKGLAIPMDRLLLPDGTTIEKRRYTFSEYRQIHEVAHECCADHGLRAVFERIKSK